MLREREDGLLDKKRPMPTDGHNETTDDAVVQASKKRGWSGMFVWAVGVVIFSPHFHSFPPQPHQEPQMVMLVLQQSQ